ncbi:MAG TPA: septum formation initiator family protein [Candidatus Acidoferrum sp.]|jgi:cell division protein FtsB
MTINFQESCKNLFANYGRHLLAIFVVVLFVHDVFGTHGFMAMRHKQQEIQKVKTELDRLNKENIGLEQDRKNLKSDPATIEKIAREEFGQSRPGEVVIKLPAQAPVEAAAAKP